MDETGFYQSQTYARSWSPVGEPCYDQTDANKGKRLNLVGAMSLSTFNIIAPHMFSGNCNRTIFENWLDILGETLSKNEQGNYPKRFLIMDNARFHHGGHIRMIARSYNITILYLPPYSPNLNPIELFWAVLKQKVRLSLHSYVSLETCILDCLV